MITFTKGINPNMIANNLEPFRPTHPGEVLKRQTILKLVWGTELQCSRTLDQHLVSLRRKLGEDPKSPRYLETVYGRGYRFKP